MAKPNYAADLEFIDGLPTRDVKAFRDYMFTKPYITANPHLFVDTAWIDAAALRSFLADRDSDRGHIMISSSSPGVSVPPARVKHEFDASDVFRDTVKVKSESLAAPVAVRMRSAMEGGHEVIELLSDSDEEMTVPETRTSAACMPSGSRGPDDSDRDDFREGTVRSSSPDFGDSEPDDLRKETVGSSSPDLNDSEPDDFQEGATRSSSPDGAKSEGSSLRKSNTVWLDPDITSMVRTVNFKLTRDRRTQVDEIEYIKGGIPSVFPVPRGRKIYILDLSDSRYAIEDDKQNLMSVDALVKRQDNDSWTGNTGTGNNEVWVNFEPGERHYCRRSRNDCSGCYACSAVDEKFLDVTRYELDLEARDRMLKAQCETRQMEGDTAAKRATVFFDRVTSTRCAAKHGDGTLCGGKPKLMKNTLPHGGKSYWIACDGWTPSFKESHRTHSIPPNVDEGLIVKLFANKPLADGDNLDTNPCSRIIHPHIGAKQKFCRHPHIINGHAVSKCPIVHRKCPCKVTFYVPVDPSIRKLLVFYPKRVPHNHPIPTLLKLSHETEFKYRKAAAAVGLVGSTVAKVDNGAFQLYREDLEKPLEERYIHRFQQQADGSLIIFTCFTALLAILDDPGVKAFEDDTTFKRIEGEINEWEVVAFYNAVERAVTLARAYINRSDTKFFERLFDIFRDIKREATGLDIRFARFMPNGNLLVMNADMEAAQTLGAALSFMKTNVPSFSGITTLDPQVFATFFIKFCGGHAMRPVNDFKSLISAENFTRLKEFMHIDSVESLRSFSKFIDGLGVKKIQDWWAHKEMNDWVIPCLVKSQSNILPADWDNTPATTNTGEAQHHWTNTYTGIKLSLVEGIETARKLDRTVVNEIKTSLTTGVLKNANNELFHHMGRSSQRQSAAAKRSRESTQRAERMAELQSMINDGKVLMKEHQDELKSLKGTSTRSTKAKSHKSTDGSIIISASSCGRVKTVPLPSKAKGVFVAANYSITVQFSLDVNSASAPGPDGNNPKYAVIDVDVPEDTEVLDSRDKDIPKSPAPTQTVTEHTNVIDIGVPEALAALESLAVPVAPAADPWEFFGRPVQFSYPAPIPASDFSAFRLGDDPTFPMSGAFDSIPSYNAFNSGFEPFFGNHGNPAYNFDLDLSLFGLDAAPNPAQHDALDSFQNLDWCALTPPQQLPTLPPPPSLSPSTPAEPVESATAVASRGKRPRRDEVDEQNIIHSKRSRTMSSRAADAAAASKKPKRS
ncbi:hypothetical protein B0H11DRAFT_2289039 [Mycena galericulata]|nr:hypothetical protein B0H11DRAFT_2289039 [Mycena galericulata]